MYDKVRQESVEVERRFNREIYKTRDEDGKLEFWSLRISYEKFKKYKSTWSPTEKDWYKNADEDFEWLVDISFDVGYHPSSWKITKPYAKSGFVWRVGPFHIIW